MLVSNGHGKSRMSGSIVASAIPRPAPRHYDPSVLAPEIIERLTYRIGKDAGRPAARLAHRRDPGGARPRSSTAGWIDTRKTHAAGDKRVYYLSLEFLIGRLMRDAMSNLGLLERVREALRELDVDLDAIAALEPDAALGNGGLGRLAACFMESMATLDMPAYGYGIRYVNGMFRQRIDDGWQIELPETWLAHGNPWEFERRESAYRDRLRRRGRAGDRDDGQAPTGSPAERVMAIASTRRSSAGAASASTRCGCGRAQPIDPIRLDAFNAGDHIGALGEADARRSADRACSIRPTRRRPGRSCGCGRSISSPRPRCRTSSAATSSIMAISARCRTRRRSSSTTRIRRSRSPS